LPLFTDETAHTKKRISFDIAAINAIPLRCDLQSYVLFKSIANSIEFERKKKIFDYNKKLGLNLRVKFTGVKLSVSQLQSKKRRKNG